MKRSRGWSECTISDLPEEILIDILSRLLIKGVATCRCVSKTWRNLLSSSNSQFTKLHFSRSPVQLFIETQTLHPNSLNFTSLDRHTLIKKFCFQIVELEDDTDLDNSFKPFPSRFSLSNYSLVAANSCNGFLCLAEFNYHFNPVLVCNPITGEYLFLPNSNHEIFINSKVVSGFGFSAKTNQYKVVRLYRGGEKPDNQTVEVYTIGTESWRTIGTAIKFPDRLSSATFFNGAIHWVVYDELNSDYIISFDLETEEFGIVPPPSHFSTEPITERCQIKIGVLGEFLYLSYNMELWVMKNYGIQESWTKVYVVDRSVDSHQAIKYLSGGKILMNYSKSELISYDPVKKMCKEFKVPQFWQFKTIAHVPSFMSFNDAMMGDKAAKLRTRMCQVQVEGRD